jgi:hypothetical protein
MCDKEFSARVSFITHMAIHTGNVETLIIVKYVEKNIFSPM